MPLGAPYAKGEDTAELNLARPLYSHTLDHRIYCERLRYQRNWYTSNPLDFLDKVLGAIIKLAVGRCCAVLNAKVIRECYGDLSSSVQDY